MEFYKDFYALYGGLERAYGTYVPGEVNETKNKVEGRAQTVTGEYKAVLWKQHLAGTKGLGVIPITDQSTCNWGAIDIDIYPLDLAALEVKVRSLKLPLVILRTKSGGAHLTLYLKKQISAVLIRSRLTEISVALGYGGVEIYPKQVKLANGRDTGNWLNMPYFDCDKTTRYAIRDNKPLDAREFLALAKSFQITEEQLTSLEIKLSDTFADGPPCLQIMAMNGVPEGGRNNALFAMGVYVMMKYEDSWEIELDACNRNVMVPPLPAKDVQMIGRSLNRKEYFFPCTKPPLTSLCNKELCKKRKYGISEGDAQDMGIILGDLVKVTTEPPLWFLDVEGVRIELDTEDMLNQERFRRLCVSALNKLPSRVKTAAYEKIIREKLESVQVQEAPVESGTKGRVGFLIEQFFNITAPAKIKDEIAIGRHWTDPVTLVTHFRGNDLLRYLELQGLRVDTRKVWTLLKDLNAGHGQVSIKGRTIPTWSITLRDDSREPFDIPNIEAPEAFD